MNADFRCFVIVAWLAVGQTLFAAEPLIYERFEGSLAGEREGGVSFSDAVVALAESQGPSRQSAFFDGEPGSWISYSPQVRLESDEFTVECFLQLAALDDYAAIASCWNEADDNRAWALMIRSDGAIRFDVSPDGRFDPGNVLTTPPGMITTGRWYHVAAVSRQGKSTIYVNGHEAASLARPAAGIHKVASTDLLIGSAACYAGKARSLHGHLDEVRISGETLAPKAFVQAREPLPEIKPPGSPDRYVLPFTAVTAAEALAWQQEARSRLLELVARQEPRRGLDEVPLDFKVEGTEERHGYRLHSISFRGNDGQRRAGLLAVPPGDGPFPAMLALHGHGGTAADVFDAEGAYRGMADRFARGGYVVLAPSQSHRPYAATALWDLFRCVDALAMRPEVDPERIGVAGLSMGGEWTMWIAACDPRLKVAVVSGWMCTTEGVFSVPNCPCWQLPGLVDLMDICEVHLVIAPRPVVFESAELDGCFPVRYTRQGFKRIQNGYRAFGAADAVVQDIWPAGHEWHGDKAYPAVDAALGGHAGLKHQ